MLIFRYLAKEVFLTLAALTSILMLIFMSNQFVRYLSRAANGNIPVMFIMKLMALELPNLLGLLLPLGFYVAVLIAYGRLYAESEMTVLQACGFGPKQLFAHTFILATGVAIIVGIMLFWLSPYIAVERAKLLRTSGVQTLIQTIVPGQFREIQQGKRVFYVENMDTAHTHAHHIFLAEWSNKNKPKWDVLWAQKAHINTEKSSGENYLTLEKGQIFQGMPGEKDYRVMTFKDYQSRLPHPMVALDKDIRTVKTAKLWPINNADKRKAAELQWRFAIPIMVIVLTMVAVPLSRVDPRSGKYAKLLPAIIVYIFYANFIFITRNWIAADKIPAWVGMWGLHALIFALGLTLMYRNRVKLS